MRSEFSLKSHAGLESMVTAIKQIIPLAQGTMTGLAIRYAINVAFTAQEGDRPKVSRARSPAQRSLLRSLPHPGLNGKCVANGS